MANYLPCTNPDCKLYGKPHPNCKDYGNLSVPELQGLASQGWELPGVYHGGRRKKMAAGGEVGPSCPSCGEMYADGGEVRPMQVVEAPSVTMAHVAAHHGLLGLLKGVGHAKLSDPDKHVMHLKKGSVGHGSPLVGSVGQSDLDPIMDRMHGPMMTHEPHPESFRASVDYLHSAMKGRDKIENHIDDLMANGKMREHYDPSARDDLKNHLQGMLVNPEKVLDIGGSLGHYLPSHGVELGAMAGNAMNYLNSIKPMSSQSGPLDPVVPPSKMAERKYNRALDIANNPLSVVYLAKTGTIQSQDMQMIANIYPKLAQTIVQRATDHLIEGGNKLTRAQKRGLSSLVGAPINFSETPLGIQAIMKANQGPQIQRDANGKAKKPAKMAVEQAEKQERMIATDSQARQMEKKE